VWKPVGEFRSSFGDMKKPQNHDGSTAGWYAGLDGIRAIAVILVFSVHYMGYRTRFVGWTGVPIFFVLSGFLITGILYDNQHEPHRFRNFYIRRTLRIFPLFYLAWLLVLIAACLLRAQWQPIQILWLTYLGNYVRFIAGSQVPDHLFTLRTPRLPLEIGHFWSLAVEEQFYLLWPLIVFHVRERKQLIRICMATIVLVLMLRIILWSTLSQNLLSMEILYRLTITQCDAFLLGGLMALWMRGPEKDNLLIHSNKILYTSLASFACAYIFNNGLHLRDLLATSPWMSTYGFTLVDLIAAGLILCSLQSGSFVFRLTTTRPLRMVGKYSYGVYVYHVMLMPFLQHYVLPVSHSGPKSVYYIRSVSSTLLYFLIVLAVSVCSYHLVEHPFLTLKDRFTVRHKNPGVEGSKV
jgi:peptidoglycan/LPS O-acetylase OafA/YrhL